MADVSFRPLVYEDKKTGERKVSENYLISDTGEVVRRFTIAPHPSGYRKIGLLREDQTGLFAVHRLVAMTYPEKVGGSRFAGANVVHHKNHDRSDNRAENLEWVSQQENVIAAYRAGRVKKTGGRVLPDGVVKNMLLAAYRLGKGSRKLVAEEFGMRVTLFNNICSGHERKRTFQEFLRENGITAHEFRREVGVRGYG